MNLAGLSHPRAARRAAFTLLEVLVVVAILVILAGVASVALFRNMDDAKKSTAVLKAKNIATAMEAYVLNPNAGGAYPTSIQELVTPSFGGSSFLKDPQQDMIDPWGNPYQISHASTDNSQQGTPLVVTTAPDGTKISQYGVGPLSRL